jgi:hypothetical protein
LFSDKAPWVPKLITSSSVPIEVTQTYLDSIKNKSTGFTKFTNKNYTFFCTKNNIVTATYNLTFKYETSRLPRFFFFEGTGNLQIGTKYNVQDDGNNTIILQLKSINKQADNNNNTYIFQKIGFANGGARRRRTRRRRRARRTRSNRRRR